MTVESKLFESMLLNERLKSSLQFKEIVDFFDKVDTSCKEFRKLFNNGSDIYGIQNSGKIGEKQYGGNLIIQKSDENGASSRCIPATNDEFSAFIENIIDILELSENQDKKIKADEQKFIAKKTDDDFVFNYFGTVFHIRTTGGGARGDVFFPTKNGEEAFLLGASSGISLSALTFIEEFMTAQLFNVAKENETSDSLLENVVFGKDKSRSKKFYSACLEMKKLGTDSVKNIFTDADVEVSTEEQFKQVFLPIIGTWKKAICDVVACMIKEIDKIIETQLGNKEHKNAYQFNDPNNFRKGCTVLSEMIAYHPSQLDEFKVDRYLDPTDIVLLNKIYTNTGTHINFTTKKKENNKRKYNSNGKIFLHEDSDSADPIRYYKAIGISLKKPTERGPAAHYIGTASLEHSVKLNVAFDDSTGEALPGSDVLTIGASIRKSSGYFYLDVEQHFADSIGFSGKDNQLEFCFRNKNPKSDSVSITGELLQVGNARGGGFGGINLIDHFYNTHDKEFLRKNRIFTGPEFISDVIQKYESTEKVMEIEQLQHEGQTIEITNAKFKRKICGALAKSLKIPFIDNKEIKEFVPSYIKIA